MGGPPHQAFSVAGHGEGRCALTIVLDLVDCIRRRESIDSRLFKLEDGRVELAVQPLKWALAAIDDGRPYEAIVLAQSASALPLWKATATALRAEGYSAVCDVLRAEEYGVPQTRRVAVLIARRRSSAMLPQPTHRRYGPQTSREAGDPKLLPWVTLGDALHCPGPFAVISNYGSAGDPRVRGQRTSVEPSFAVTGRVLRSRVVAPDGRTLRLSLSGAGRLQTFPSDYPWSGRNVPQQIGGTVPPLLAAHVIASALDLPAQVVKSATRSSTWGLLMTDEGPRPSVL